MGTELFHAAGRTDGQPWGGSSHFSQFWGKINTILNKNFWIAITRHNE